MKIFVTGADSFVGKNFLERYANRHKFFVPEDGFDPTDINQVIGQFRRRKVDAVLHLAEYSGAAGFDADTELKNVLAFKNIQSVASAYGVKKVIVLSNENEYDTTAELTRVTESERASFRPSDSYGYSKYIVTDFARFDANVTVVRSFGAYGKYMPEDSWLVRTALDAYHGREMTAETDCTFSAIFIDDLVKIINDFLLKGYPSGDYNIAASESVTVKSVLNRFKRESGTGFKIAAKGMGAELTASNAKFLDTVGGAYRFSSARSGLGKLYKWLSDTND